jgi:hypothetical protein
MISKMFRLPRFKKPDGNVIFAVGFFLLMGLTVILALVAIFIDRQPAEGNLGGAATLFGVLGVIEGLAWIFYND